MSQGIAISGTKLHEIQMQMTPYPNGSVGLLSYPKSQIRFSLDDGILKLTLPAYLGLELYRIGILPQDPDTPVTVHIGGRPAGSFVVSDVRYPHESGAFCDVLFTFSRVSARKRQNRNTARKREPETYVIDITHYLDESGELADMPRPARKLASYFALLIDAVIEAFPTTHHDTEIRCRASKCSGSIRASLTSTDDQIEWYCPECGQNGVIRNWQCTKWNRTI